MKKISLYFLKLYQKYISPLFAAFGYHCKYYPTCSEYAKQAVEKYGFFKGSFYSLKRILKCNQFSKVGYDHLN